MSSARCTRVSNTFTRTLGRTGRLDDRRDHAVDEIEKTLALLGQTARDELFRRLEELQRRHLARALDVDLHAPVRVDLALQRLELDQLLDLADLFPGRR